ncbi:hypothetical protein VCHA53O466_50041 [Vibrio chagasii]|nr:hypothetical protein VCHA53O466_50041 [Vibrio chagasii]
MKERKSKFSKPVRGLYGSLLVLLPTVFLIFPLFIIGLLISASKGAMKEFVAEFSKSYNELWNAVDDYIKTGVLVAPQRGGK